MPFMDVRCKCGKKIGWVGEMADRPKCPQCGDRPSDEDLKKAQKSLDANRAILDDMYEKRERRRGARGQ